MKPLVLVAAVLVIGLTGVVGVALTSPSQAQPSPRPEEHLSDSARIEIFRATLEARSRRENNAPSVSCHALVPHTGDLDQDGLPDLAVQFDCTGPASHDSDQGNGYTEVAVFLGPSPQRRLMGRLQRNEQDPDLGLLRLVGIRDGRLELEMRRYAPGDKRCCPSRVSFERYAVSGRRFVASNP